MLLTSCFLLFTTILVHTLTKSTPYPTGDSWLHQGLAERTANVLNEKNEERRLKVIAELYVEDIRVRTDILVYG